MSTPTNVLAGHDTADDQSSCVGEDPIPTNRPDGHGTDAAHEPFAVGAPNHRGATA